MSEEPRFPPLADLAEHPLHGWDYGHPYACQGGGEAYDWRCADCVALAWLACRSGSLSALWKRDPAAAQEKVDLSWLVSRSLFWGVPAAPRCGCVLDEHESWCPAWPELVAAGIGDGDLGVRSPDRTVRVRRTCLRRGHAFREWEGSPVPFVFCRRWRCDASAVREP